MVIESFLHKLSRDMVKQIKIPDREEAIARKTISEQIKQLLGDLPAGNLNDTMAKVSFSFQRCGLGEVYDPSTGFCLSCPVNKYSKLGKFDSM